MIQQDLFSTSAPLAVATLREIGDTGKQRGMTLAADAKAEVVAAGQVALLRALLATDDGTATIDDATDDLTHQFAGARKWRGQVPSGLSRRRIIEPTGRYRKTLRPSAHSRENKIWRLRNREKAQREIERLTAWLSAVEKESQQSEATDAGKVESTNTNSNTCNGENENAII